MRAKSSTGVSPDKQLERRVQSLETRLSTLSAAGQSVRQQLGTSRLPPLASRPAQPTTSREAAPPQPVLENEQSLDELATAAFDDQPGVALGFFGPSSNHALFRNLSSIFLNSLQLRSAVRMGEPAEVSFERPQPDLDLTDGGQAPFPLQSTACLLIERFFISTGRIVPYINRQHVGELYSHAYHRLPCRKSSMALLNIIWAHAAASLIDHDPRPYYKETKALLTRQTPHLETGSHHSLLLLL